jgi:hypothetical protein
MKLKLNPEELVKQIMCEKYFRDRFVSTDWNNYENYPEIYEKDYKVMKRVNSVTIKIQGGYNRLMESEKEEIVVFLKSKFDSVENVMDIKFVEGENFAGTKYDWLKIKLEV